MSNGKSATTVIKAKTDFAGAVLVLCTFGTVLLFIGEPDLHDALMTKLAGPVPVVAEVQVESAAATTVVARESTQSSQPTETREAVEASE